MRDTPGVQAVIFDWAGTIIDYGSRQPALAFQDLFRTWGLEVSLEAVRASMGLGKREHIQTLLWEEDVLRQWRQDSQRDPGEEDLQAMLGEYEEALKEAVRSAFAFIPGFFALVSGLRSRGIRIGTTTGYTRPIVEVLLEAAEAQGFVPEATVCSSDVPEGRPAPWMNLQCAMALRAFPVNSLITVGDTLQDVLAGHNAGMWTVGVAQTGNGLGLRQEEAEGLPDKELASRMESIKEGFREAGADEVIDGIWDLLPVVDGIDSTLKARGRRG